MGNENNREKREGHLSERGHKRCRENKQAWGDNVLRLTFIIEGVA